MERIFWVQCPSCPTRWYADWAMRHGEHALICPSCGKEFRADEAPWRDERESR
ncbi:MAG: hypothetical protein ACYDA8_20280 [Deferrisomatales bacterium]